GDVTRMVQLVCRRAGTTAQLITWREFWFISGPGKMFLVPGAEGWTLISPGAESGAWRVRGFASLDDAAQALSVSDDFVFALPVSAVLAQRIRLPNVEGAELREMVRIQIEKALPFSADEVT